MWDYKRQRKRVPPGDGSYRLTGVDVFKAITDLWRKHVSKDIYLEILALLKLDFETIELTQRQFSVLCAFIERYMFEQTRSHNIGLYTYQTSEPMLYSAPIDPEKGNCLKFNDVDDRERADLSTLQKLFDFDVNGDLIKFFTFIQTTHLKT